MSSQRTRVSWFASLLAGSLFLFPLACKKQPASTPDSPATARTTIAVGYLPVSTSLPNWIADKEGIAARYDLELKFVRYANSDLLLFGLINGEIQATSVCADEPILAAASRGKLDAEIYLQEILTSDRLFDAIIVRANSPLQDIRDLAGKTVACFPGSQLRAYLRIILEKAGVDPATVNIQQLPPPNMLPALEGGTVDACFALEPTITVGVHRGVARVLVPTPIVRYISGGEPICAASFLISRQWADKHPEVADAFVRSVYEALEMIDRDYPRTAARYPEFTPIPSEIAPHVVITRFATVREPDIRGLRLEEQVLRQAESLEGPVNVESLIYRWRTTP